MKNYVSGSSYITYTYTTTYKTLLPSGILRMARKWKIHDEQEHGGSEHQDGQGNSTTRSNRVETFCQKTCID
jgi:hypothetical protein